MGEVKRRDSERGEAEREREREREGERERECVCTEARERRAGKRGRGEWKLRGCVVSHQYVYEGVTTCTGACSLREDLKAANFNMYYMIIANLVNTSSELFTKNCAH